MLHHVALFTWKPGFLHSAEMEEWAARLRRLPDSVAPLRSITIGCDTFHGERSWDTAVIAVLDDLEGLSMYTRHPEHDAATAISAPHIEHLAQVDFETS